MTLPNFLTLTPRPLTERGQSTAEYALVLVAVTALVAVVIAYLSGDGGGAITGLFGSVFARMRSLIGA
ncbi:MAG TPA: DUF4244 domain-containing protein [Microthrixaceae bacterium]|nr:DUF4244 domain-containing protein [Microthrixaceae bacterium]HNI36595.1 DUF4244 domain-containing protein [Microthrixaceae bacterium]